MTYAALLFAALTLAGCTASAPTNDAAPAAGPAAPGRPAIAAGLSECAARIGVSVLEAGHIPLYPKSTITAVYCRPAQDGAGDVNRGPFVITFVSPAAPQAVRDWIRVTALRSGHPIPDDGTRFTGKYGDGAPFHIVIAGHGADQASGVIDIAGLPVG